MCPLPRPLSQLHAFFAATADPLFPARPTVMMKNVQGMSEADHKKRMAVLDDITNWFIEQSEKDNA